MPRLGDARYAVRVLLKQRAFTAAALLTLALCIGANTAIFSVLRSVLLKPLPFEGADRLVAVYNSYPRAGVERGGASVPDYYDRLELPALQDVAMMQTGGVTIGEGGRPERVTVLRVTPSLFPMLGASAAVGRTFLAEEGEPGAERQVVLSWGLWQDRFAGDPDAVGGTLRVNDVAHTIVGVMPRRFAFHDPNVRLWLPLAFPAELRADDARHSNNWVMVARLWPGATVAQAQQQVDALNAANDERLPEFAEILSQVGFRTVVADYRAELTRPVRGTLWLLQAGVILVLLIGCVNVANLVLVRATARQRELATRSALGAAPARLARQLMTEGVVLALAGGAVGVLAGWAALRGFAAFALERLPRGTEIGLDATTFVIALLVSAVAGVLFSAIPLARLLRADLGAVFREDARTGTAGRGTNVWRGGLVVAQVALAFTLLAGAGLMMTSFARTLAVDPGFEPDGVLAASVSLPVTRYADGAARRRFTEELLERVRALPGVSAAGVTDALPFGSEMNASAVTPEGHEPRPDDPVSAPMIARVSEGYFETMGIRLVAGRTFTPADVAAAAPVAIVDRYLANRFWPGQDPIGRRVVEGVPSLELMDDEYRTVVGVVESVRVLNLTGDQPLGHYYTPAAQTPTASISMVVRAAPGHTLPAGPLHAVVAGLDPDLALYDVRTMEERLADSVATERLRAMLLAAFGALALVLAVIGLYGVLAYSVAQRRTEIGIRLALGSSATAVFRMVVAQGARLLGIGLVLGLAGGLALGRLARSLLYGVEPGDPVVLAAALALLSAAALAACLLPARRAMAVDPATAMRDGG